MKTIGILQPGYLPWLGFFEQLYKSDIFVIYDDVQYDKNGWRNRNRIKTPNGPIWLTVPVLTTGKSSQKVCEAVPDPKVNWGEKHLKSIEMNYRKAPFFSEYFPGLQDILLRTWPLLADLDCVLIKWLMNVLGFEREIVRSSTLGIGGDKIERLVQICKRFDANCFYEGQSGENYIDVGDFEKEGIRVDFQNYRHPVYKQLYGPFLSHLSIIDLTFNHGSSSLQTLLNQ